MNGSRAALTAASWGMFSQELADSHGVFLTMTRLHSAGRETRIVCYDLLHRKTRGARLGIGSDH